MGEATDDLRRGRSAYAQNAWRDAYASLAAADRQAGLEVDDLVLLAMSALLSGKFQEGQAGMERTPPGTPREGQTPRCGTLRGFPGNEPRHRGRDRLRRRVVRSRPAARRAGKRGLRGARISVASRSSFGTSSLADYESAYDAAVESAAIAERFHDPRPTGDDPSCRWVRSSQAGEDRGRPRAARRGDGLGDRAERWPRSSPGSSTAAPSPRVRTRSSPGGRGSGRTRWRTGASPSPSWFPSPGAASRTGLESSSSTATGAVPSRRRGWLASGASRR